MFAIVLTRKICTRIQFRTNCVRRNFSLKYLQQRGLIKDSFPEQRDEIYDLFKQPQTVYAGFDPTADSLHVGNLLTILALINLQRLGHRVICVLGDATAAIGDPSGKKTERPVLSDETIANNVAGISSDINKIFANHFKYFRPKGATKDNLEEPIILNNGSWYRSKNVIEFVSKVGRNIRMTEMLSRSSVRDRLESSEGLSFGEFSYQMFQAYDWLYLFDKYDCGYQVGGADQLGNIVTGYQLIRRFDKVKPVYGLLTPLITNDQGYKIGKTDTGQAVWLSRQKLSAFDFYQYFIRLPDTQVEQFLKLFTFLEDQEIEHIMQRFLRKKESRYAQERLAEVITLLVHGEEGLNLAKRTTDALYTENVESIGNLTQKEMEEVFGHTAISTTVFLEPGVTTVLDMAMAAHCFPDPKDAISAIRAGGFYVNYKRTTTASSLIDDSHILANNTTLLRVGKRRYFIVKWH